MLNRSYISNEVSCLLVNDAFIYAMLDNSGVEQTDWHLFTDTTNYSMAALDEARNILLHLDEPSEAFSSKEIDDLKSKIQSAL